MSEYGFAPTDFNENDVVRVHALHPLYGNRQGVVVRTGRVVVSVLLDCMETERPFFPGDLRKMGAAA